MSLRLRHAPRRLARVARKCAGFVPQLVVLQTDLRLYQDYFRRWGWNPCQNKDAWERSPKVWWNP